jgi:hypothetical protein
MGVSSRALALAAFIFAAFILQDSNSYSFPHRSSRSSGRACYYSTLEQLHHRQHQQQPTALFCSYTDTADSAEISAAAEDDNTMMFGSEPGGRLASRYGATYETEFAEDTRKSRRGEEGETELLKLPPTAEEIEINDNKR